MKANNIIIARVCVLWWRSFVFVRHKTRKFVNIGQTYSEIIPLFKCKRNQRKKRKYLCPYFIFWFIFLVLKIFFAQRLDYDRIIESDSCIEKNKAK